MTEYSRRTSRLRRASRLFSLLPLGVMLAIGCGVEEYQERLDTTAKYFASLELQNANLHGAWTDPHTTISLRLPLQFAEIPAPEGFNTEPGASSADLNPVRPNPNQAATGEEEADEEEAVPEEEGQPNGFGQGPAPADPRAANNNFDEGLVDPRQPHYLTIALPGLRGAFRAQLAVVGGNGQSALGSGYIYVLSNHHLAGNAEGASRFHVDLLEHLCSNLSVTLKPEDSHELTLPQRADAFMRKTSYTEVEFEPSEQPDEMAREFGVATRFSVYLHTEGDVQIAVIFVLPRDLDTAERMSNRRPLSLETLRIESLQLSKPGGAGAIGGGSASGSSF